MMRIRLLFAFSTMVLMGTMAACGTSGGAETPPAASDTSPSPTSIPAAATETPVPLNGRGGGRIVYASKRDENYDIYVMNADGSGQRRLTFHPAEDTDPAWSPDGRMIAFTSYRSGTFEVYVMNADGSNLRQLTHGGGWGPSWSPDSSLIAFTRHDPFSSIFIMNANGSDERRLTPDDLELDFTNQEWSPDGTRMICVIDTKTLRTGPLDSDESIAVLEVEAALQGSGDVTLRELPRAGEMVNDWPAWSPDGSQIVFSAQVGRHRDLYLINVDGSGLQRLTLDDANDEFAPTWSPDGSRIAFQSSAAGGWDIYTIRLDGMDLQRLTTDFANDVAPSWVP
jgi:Tol biopolymer transport system component/predicted small lipoprotein YifL